MDYPFFDEDYRSEFETHLIRRFYTNNVGFETAELFKFELETWLMINMPYYNSLFESERKKFDPFVTTDIETTYEKKKDSKGDSKILAKDDGSNTEKQNNDFSSKSDGTSKSDTNVTNDSSTHNASKGESKTNNTNSNFQRDISSDTPQSRLELTTNDGSGIIEYANEIKEKKSNGKDDSTQTGSNTNDGTQKDVGVSKNTGESHDTSSANEIKSLDKTNKNVKDVNQTNSNNQLENFIQRRYGKEGFQTYASVLNEYRSTLINVESMIFDDLRNLFMLIYF